MESQFGQQVYEQAQQLQQQGKDANQIAKILCDQDPDGHNYGIGIVLGGDGKPIATTSTLLEYTAAELKQSTLGKYMNSNALMEEVKIATLKWQRIPEEYWGNFKLALPSDAGTGAVKTALEMALVLDNRVTTLGLEELGWPAYKAMAKLSRLDWKEFPFESVIDDDSIFPIYQASPMNTTGFVQAPDTIEARAKAAAAKNAWVLLDRAYPGFEFARLLHEESYDAVMRKSYELQIKPFLDQGAPFFLAIGPTKAFVTFALRPSGLLLVYCPDSSQMQEVSTLLNQAIRARGSAFEHPVTRAFAKAMTQDFGKLEAEQIKTLERLAEAEVMWRKLVQGTPMEYLYADNYAGLFRNPKVREGAEVAIYDQHVYPVFSKGRCRQNMTGIPHDEELARKHVKVFAEQCY
jgi:aspartate/tyrosine/aromatic aminotransferase